MGHLSLLNYEEDTFSSISEGAKNLALITLNRPLKSSVTGAFLWRAS